MKHLQTRNENQPVTHKRSPAARVFADPIAFLRDRIAIQLARTGITPNVLTILGMIFTLIGAYYLAVGAEQTWSQATLPLPVYAGIFFFLASAMDMLDGALARFGNLHTTFGGILDSSVDRISDMAIFGAIALAYARTGNLTFTALAILALSNAVMISYVKARAECELPAMNVGFWQRGERIAGVLIVCFAANVNTLTLMMATLPAMSAVYRLYYCYLQTKNPHFKPPAPSSPLTFWRYPRGTWPSVIQTSIYILILIFLRFEATDVLARWLSR